MIEAMIDNETWGIRVTSVVRSIGVVVFEGRNVLEKHYFRVDEAEQIARGRTYDMSTVNWWRKPENAEAQAKIAEAPLWEWERADSLLQTIGHRCDGIWAKPGMFDLPMLRDMFGQGIWPYWKERDFSTLLAEFDPKRTSKPPFKGTPHVAIDDALWTHQWLCDLRDSIPRIIAEREVDEDEYRAMEAAMEQIDPATLPGLTVAQRCALGRFAKPAGRHAGCAQPVAWAAADTLNSPHPTCVSSLAYMSQFDRERGREYVPLYAAPVAAQAPATDGDALEDYKENGAMAVRFAPSSAYWSNELRRLFGPDAREGIDRLEERLRAVVDNVEANRVVHPTAFVQSQGGT